MVSENIICVLGEYASILNRGIGAPASGKGTICRKLAEDYDLYHLSVGDLVRAQYRDGTFDNDEMARLCIDQGKLLATQFILPILKNKVEEEDRHGQHGYLLDGFPRRLDQGLEFEKTAWKET